MRILTCLASIALPALLLAGCQQELQQMRDQIATVLPSAPAATTPMTRMPKVEPGITYTAFNAKHGEAREAILSADGSHFISRHGGWNDADKDDKTEATIRLWRIAGEDAHLVSEWHLPRSDGYSMSTNAAISPDGRMVALIGSLVDDTGKVARQIDVYRAGSSTSRQVEIRGHVPGGAQGCTLAFLDADTLAANFCNVRSRNSWLLLVGGMSGSAPAVMTGSLIQGKYTSFSVSPDGRRINLTNYDNAAGYEYRDGKPVKVFSGFPQNRLKPVKQKGSKHEYISDGIEAVHELPDGRKLVMAFDHVEIWKSDARQPDGIYGSRVIPYELGRKASLSPDGQILVDSTGKLYLIASTDLVRVVNESALTVRYDSGRRELLSITGDGIYRETISEQRLAAARTYAEGLGMANAGFMKAGFGKIRQSASLDPTYWIENAKPNTDDLAQAVSEGLMKADLAEMGQTLLHIVSEMENIEKQTRTIAVGSIRDRDGKATIPKLDRTCLAENPLVSAGVKDGDHVVMADGQPVASRKAYYDIIRRVPAGQPVEIVTTAPDGTRRITSRVDTFAEGVPNPLGYQGINLTIFGLLAVQAGHPGIALQVENRLRQIVAEKRGCIAGIAWANLLGGLARAANGDPEAGYEYILANGGLDANGGERLGVHYAEMHAIAAAPLYRDRAKMAFLMKKQEEELQYIPVRFFNPPPQPYPDLNGNLIQPSGMAVPVSGAPPAVSATPAAGTAPELRPASAPASASPRAAAPAGSGGGVVLD